MDHSNVTTSVLKDCKTVIAEPLCSLINSFLEESRLVNHLKQAYANQLLRIGDTEDRKKHTAFSIATAFSKIYWEILKEQITDYFDQNHLFSQVQNGLGNKFYRIEALV